MLHILRTLKGGRRVSRNTMLKTLGAPLCSSGAVGTVVRAAENMRLDLLPLPVFVIVAHVHAALQCGVVAEWSACLAVDHEVVGSIPFSLGRASSLKYTSSEHR